MKYALLGSTEAYYKFNDPRFPVAVYCDGVNDKADLNFSTSNSFSFSTTINIKSLHAGTNAILSKRFEDDGMQLSIEDTSISFWSWDLIASSWVKLTSAVPILIGQNVSISASYNDATKNKTLTVNDITVSDTLANPVKTNTQKYFIASGAYYQSGDFLNASYSKTTLNGTSYIQQGDQNPNNILPSHPSGADGTLVNGAKWVYDGIEEHFETVAQWNAYLASVTSTEPWTVIVISPVDLAGDTFIRLLDDDAQDIALGSLAFSQSIGSADDYRFEWDGIINSADGAIFDNFQTNKGMALTVESGAMYFYHATGAGSSGFAVVAGSRYKVTVERVSGVITWKVNGNTIETRSNTTSYSNVEVPFRLSGASPLAQDVYGVKITTPAGSYEWIRNGDFSSPTQVIVPSYPAGMNGYNSLGVWSNHTAAPTSDDGYPIRYTRNNSQSASSGVFDYSFNYNF